VPGPVGYVEVWLGVGSERLLGRFHEFRTNRPATIVGRRPSRSAAAGEAAFWDVLWGDDASEARQQSALAALRRAARRDRSDGRSRFLLGMLHLYRFGQTTPDYRRASADARAEIDAAEAALGAAAARLWDGRRGDTRVPGFAAAAKYVQGVVHDDAARVQEGLAELEAAVAINPIFNLFDLIGVVPPVTPATDPLYARVIEVMDFALNGENATCVVSQPEICGNAGMAPHNIEGALLLFGDLYAKGGIVDDPYVFRGARNLYTFVRNFAEGSGWNPTFRAAVETRLADVDARAALYLNGDPADDPPLVGTQPGEACATCHHKR
jgi:hypothetical protein